MQLEFKEVLMLSGVVLLGLEILGRIIPFVCSTLLHVEEIPIKGKHLDELDSTDKLYITINKCFTCLFVYHMVLVTTSTESIKWAASEATLSNTLGSLVLFYLFYDFFYMWFHWLLHLRSLYPLIHKHHHRQKAPSRGNVDAINVHPFEYVVGEYLHLVTVYLIPCHMYAVAVFILAGGILASLNHTRFNIKWGPIYNVDVHDLHHRVPECNYAQYHMLWDRIFGFYRPYNSREVKDE